MSFEYNLTKQFASLLGIWDGGNYNMVWKDLLKCLNKSNIANVSHSQIIKLLQFCYKS